MKTISVISLITLFSIVTAFSQSTEKWKRVETDDFSISVPPTFIVDAEKKSNSVTHKIWAFQGGARVELDVSQPSDPKSRLNNLFFDKEFDNTNLRKGKTEVVRMSSKTEIHERVFIATRKKFYRIELRSDGATLETARKILLSIKAEGESLFASNTSNVPNLEEDIVKLSELRTSSEVAEAMSTKYEKQKISVVNKPLKDFNDDTDYGKFSRPPIVVDKPNPRYRPGFEFGGRYEFFVKLKVNLLKNGKVGDIVTFSDSNQTFVSSCVEAAKKIKFIPAQKDDKNIDSTHVIEYRLISAVVITRTPFTMRE